MKAGKKKVKMSMEEWAATVIPIEERIERFEARVARWHRRRWAIMRRAPIRRMQGRWIPTLNRGEYWIARRRALLEDWWQAAGKEEIQ